jgi:predicted 3-demethylubiquinone-9 3-methyltransferase (glyoxalase superfamily)
MQKIVPFLWFDKEAEEAVNFYVSIFKNSIITSVSRYGQAGPGPKGSVMSLQFELEGLKFIALNGGPQYKFTPAISMFVSCATQAEVDELWDKLAAGGGLQQCGWVQDRYGLTWQIIPTVLMELLRDRNPKKAQAVMKSMLGMQKLDIAGLKRAYEEA